MKIGDMVEYDADGKKGVGELLEIGDNSWGPKTHLVDVGLGNGHNGALCGKKKDRTGDRVYWFEPKHLKLVAPKKVFKHGDVWRGGDDGHPVLATPAEIKQAEGYLAAQALPPKPVYKINKGDKLVNEQGFVVEATCSGGGHIATVYGRALGRFDNLNMQSYTVDRNTGKVHDNCGAWSGMNYKLDIVGKVVAL